MQTGHFIQTRKPDIGMILKNKTCCQVDFFIPAGDRLKYKKKKKRKKGETIEKCVDLARELK